MKLRKEPTIMNEFNKIFEATQRANKFGKTLKLLEDKIGEDDSQDVQEALEYLKSLQPVLPQFVIDWTRGKKPHDIYRTLYLSNSEDRTDTDEKVYKWFEEFEKRDENDIFLKSWLIMQMIVNTIQCGAIAEVDLYYIRAPKEWDEHETPYVCIPDCVPDAYALTMHHQYAEKFTKEEAVATMRKLRVNWHLEKVE